MRYVSKAPKCSPAGDDDWWRDSDGAWAPDAGGASSITVHADEPNTFSGLYDAAGNELHRERPGIGFDLSRT